VLTLLGLAGCEPRLGEEPSNEGSETTETPTWPDVCETFTTRAGCESVEGVQSCEWVAMWRPLVGGEVCFFEDVRTACIAFEQADGCHVQCGISGWTQCCWAPEDPSGCGCSFP
jgi:hypothetical protein